MARMTSRKDSLASFIWTVGAADMVIGGVGERGSLFALGLLTVGAGFLVRWLRHQRAERTGGSWSGPLRSPLKSQVRRPLQGLLPVSAQRLSGQVRGVSTFMTRQWQSSRGTTANSRSARGYSAAARPGFRANRFVNPVTSRPRSGQSLRSTPVRPHSPGVNLAGSQSATSGRLPLQGPALQGPPLNLPPAPQPRARRGRRIY